MGDGWSIHYRVYGLRTFKTTLVISQTTFLRCYGNTSEYLWNIIACFKIKRWPRKHTYISSLFIRFYFIHFSRLKSISIILFWENTRSASENYQVFEISNHSCYVTLLYLLPYLTLPYILPYITLPYHTIPNVLPYLTIPYLNLPYLMSYLSLLYLTLTLPCRTLSYVLPYLKDLT